MPLQRLLLMQEGHFLVIFFCFLAACPDLTSQAPASCQETLTAAQGSVKSPNFPDFYPNNIRCTWLIQTKPGYIVHLRTVSFDLEESNSCSGDAVHIYDGENEQAKLIERPFCGSSIPLSLASSASKLFIVFNSDFGVRRNGFHFEYSTFQACTRTLRSASGVIRSPYYPKPYPSDANCTFFIVADRNRRIKVTFTDVDIEPRPPKASTCYDYVAVYDVLPSKTIHLKTICGKQNPGAIYSQANKLLIRFVSDGSDERRGFEARFASHDFICGKDQFSCGNGHCVSLTRACNGRNDCGDGSDEASCPCHDDQWKCPNGWCIAANQTCNGVKDCPSGSDEDSCIRRNVTAKCGPSMPRCELTCTHIDDALSCACSEGYKYNAATGKCEDDDECLSENGGCKELCINFPGGFRCGCRKTGFKVEKGKCVDIDECGDNSHQCQQICINTPGSYHCECMTGYYRPHNDPKRCRDIDECLEGVPACFGRCINTMGSYYCLCEPGFESIERRTRCRDVDECAHGTSGCAQLCKNTFGSYTCSCQRGFQKNPRNDHLCVDTNECRTPNPCQHDCINTHGSFRCRCPKGFLLVNKTLCKDVNECLDPVTYPCQGKCKNLAGSYKCVCPRGQLLLHDGRCLPADSYDVCGRASPWQGDDRWKESSSEVWGWQAFFSVTIGRFEMLLDECMGTIISNRFVLTAAHCLKLHNWRVTPANLTVHVRQTNILGGSSKGYQASDIHFRTTSERHFSDVALVELAEPLAFDAHVHAICVPEIPWGHLLRTGKEATLLAWGKFNSSRPVPVLQYRQVTLRETGRCRSIQEKKDQWPNLFCAEYNGNTKGEHCLPASGAPLMRRSLVYYGDRPVSSWTLGGILVYGGGYSKRQGCYHSYKYNAIHRLDPVLPWIWRNVNVGQRSSEMR